jgi:hypothetical protein
VGGTHSQRLVSFRLPTGGDTWYVYVGDARESTGDGQELGLSAPRSKIIRGWSRPFGLRLYRQKTTERLAINSSCSQNEFPHKLWLC